MKALFRKTGTADHSAKQMFMGAASSRFQDRELGADLKTSIRLAYFLFGKLDRQIISAMEITYNVKASHRQNIRKFIGEVAQHPMSLTEILRPHRKDAHNARYRIFGEFCKIAASNPRHDMKFIKKIISVGQALKLSEDEIFRWIKQTRLAE